MAIEYGVIDPIEESAQCNSCENNNFQGEIRDKIYYLLVGNMRIKLCLSCAKSVKNCMASIAQWERKRQRKLC